MQKSEIIKIDDQTTSGISLHIIYSDKKRLYFKSNVYFEMKLEKITQ